MKKKILIRYPGKIECQTPLSGARGIRWTPGKVLPVDSRSAASLVRDSGFEVCFSSDDARTRLGITKAQLKKLIGDGTLEIITHEKAEWIPLSNDTVRTIKGKKS